MNRKILPTFQGFRENGKCARQSRTSYKKICMKLGQGKGFSRFSVPIPIYPSMLACVGFMWRAYITFEVYIDSLSKHRKFLRLLLLLFILKLNWKLSVDIAAAADRFLCNESPFFAFTLFPERCYEITTAHSNCSTFYALISLFFLHFTKLYE